MSEQTRPRDTLACCWDVKQATYNNPGLLLPQVVHAQVRHCPMLLTISVARSCWSSYIAFCFYLRGLHWLLFSQLQLFVAITLSCRLLAVVLSTFQGFFFLHWFNHLCVCVCVRACVRACVCVSVCLTDYFPQKSSMKFLLKYVSGPLYERAVR